MEIFYNPEKKTWPEILRRPLIETESLHNHVRAILDDIRERGESAIRDYTLRYDGIQVHDWEPDEEEFTNAEKKLEKPLKEAIAKAAANITLFHGAQIHPVSKIETTPGVWCWQKQVPIRGVGLYVPGGSAPLFSTVLMLAIPAKLAGCTEIILCTPPSRDGSIHPAVLYSARLAGVSRVLRIGGVQAIGAMAFGIISPKVDKIFGPGNQYVMAAKQLAGLRDVATDLPAGPSEVAVLADRSSNPAFVAADLLSQAEHGPDSQVLLVLKGDAILEKILRETENQLEVLPRREIARKALESGRIVVFDDDESMISLVNWYAPEHLIICTSNYGTMASGITNAGSVFLGGYTPESAGDYASGTNHTLPTNGWARSTSGVNMDSFMKKITFQEISVNGLQNLGPVIETMAEAESLEAHKNAVTIRLLQSSHLVRK
jgi:histidinol dehydrogenase